MAKLTANELRGLDENDEEGAANMLKPQVQHTKGENQLQHACNVSIHEASVHIPW